MATRKMTDRAAEAWLSEPVTVHLFRDNGSYKEDIKESSPILTEL